MLRMETSRSSETSEQTHYHTDKSVIFAVGWHGHHVSVVAVCYYASNITPLPTACECTVAFRGIKCASDVIQVRPEVYELTHHLSGRTRPS